MLIILVRFELNNFSFEFMDEFFSFCNEIEERKVKKVRGMGEVI